MERAQLAKYDLPDVPGVYLFTHGKGRSKKILYVGKATSLRDRVRSYFDDDLISTRGPRVVDMVTVADGLMHETTPTVLEALVREAALIREHRPKANAMGKDDKSFLYAVITDEKIPRVLAIRGTDLDFKEKKIVVGDIPLQAMHGPFTSGYQLREALRLIRRIFPFYDTPRPVGEGTRFTQGKVEFNRQIGHYPKDLSRSAYMRSIRHVSMYLSGRVKSLRTALEREMKLAAKEERFEEAAMMRGQLFALDHVQDVSLIREDRDRDETSPRIEAYDTAHLSGTNAIGVMVVVDGGIPDKKEYRSFRIRGAAHAKKIRTSDVLSKKSPANTGSKKLRTSDVKTLNRQNDDIASLREILSRRFGHPEWTYPKAIVVDGGKTHKKAAETLLAELGIQIPVAAVVKDEKHRPREVLGALRAHITDADAVLANSEAHRFSITLHRKARSRSVTA
jgi:excinuclease ABC subunit C